jgi:mono/diheme cytochrome c family protein
LPGIAADENLEPKALFEKRCTRCHGLDKTNRPGPPDFWKSTVKKMKEKWFSGISERDMEIITQYLVENRAEK